MRTISLSPLLALFALLAPAPASAATWVVDDDGGPGVDFFDVPRALAVARPGDVVVVRDGTYSPFELVRGVAMLADAGARPVLGAGLVREVPVEQIAAISGFRIDRLDLIGCRGLVRLDDLRIGPAVEDLPALRVEDCGLVTVHRSIVRGRDGLFLMIGDEEYVYRTAERAAELRNARVIVSESAFRGGSGYDGPFTPGGGSDGGDGRVGVFADHSALYLQTSSARGGRGGDGYPHDFKIWAGGDGAPGLDLVRCDVDLFGLGSSVVRGGTGGTGSNFLAPDGVSAPAVRLAGSRLDWSGVTFETAPFTAPIGATSSTVTQVVPAVPVLSIDGPGELGGRVGVTLHAGVGWTYRLFAATRPDVRSAAPLHTDHLLDLGGALPLVGGVVPAGGATSDTLAIPLVPALLGAGLELQAAVTADSGTSYLSTSAGLTIR